MLELKVFPLFPRPIQISLFFLCIFLYMTLSLFRPGGHLYSDSAAPGENTTFFKKKHYTNDLSSKQFYYVNICTFKNNHFLLLHHFLPSSTLNFSYCRFICWGGWRVYLELFLLYWHIWGSEEENNVRGNCVLGSNYETCFYLRSYKL